MKVIHPGEKLYSNADYSPGYYNNEGWVIGSTNKINYKKFSNNNANFFGSLDSSKMNLKEEKLYKNKLIKDEFAYNRNYVFNLNEWDKVFYDK